jgi:hypothetical protein
MPAFSRASFGKGTVMDRLVVAALSAIAVVGLAACAADPGATQISASTAPPGGVATQAPVSTRRSVSDKCTGIPTLDPGNVDSIPKFSPDPSLAPTFPNIGGGPSPAITFARWLDSVCVFGGEAVVQQHVADLPNVEFETLMVGYSLDSLDTPNFDSIQLLALRTPGHDANELMGLFVPLILAGAGTGPETTANLGGKNVTLWTNADTGKVTYAYLSGDTIFGLSDETDDIAATVFEALP